MRLQSPAIPGTRTSCPLLHARVRTPHGQQQPHGIALTSGRRSMLSHTSIYDNPALYTNDDTFGEGSYWEKRYRESSQTFEWYRGYTSLRPLILKYFPKELPVLQLGMGTSVIQHDMVAMDRYHRVVSVDISATAVEHMRELHAGVAELEYEVADVRSMPNHADGTFAGILDKGTLCALLCGDDDEHDSHAMLSECVRLLEPGGVYLSITHASPKSRLRYLSRPEYAWDIKVYEVGQQGYMAGPYDGTGALANPLHPGSTAEEAELTSRLAKDDGGHEVLQSQGSDFKTSSDSSSSSSRTLAPLPPPGCLREGSPLLQLPKQPYSHFVYVCRKPVLACGLQQP